MSERTNDGDADWLEFARQRALEYVGLDQYAQAVTSLFSDLLKNDRTLRLLDDTEMAHGIALALDAASIRQQTGDPVPENPALSALREWIAISPWLGKRNVSETTLIQPEFMQRVLIVARRIDNALVSTMALLDSLKDPPPFGAFGPDGKWEPAGLQVGVARYGNGPLAGLWTHCRDMVALHVDWTGKPYAQLMAPPMPPPPVVPLPPPESEA